MSDNYPLWWDSTITVYNKHRDKVSGVVKWYRTTIPNCFWKYVGDKVVIGNSTLETNSIVCRIPEDSRYAEKHIWVSIPSSSKPDYFTLWQGDIIVFGEVFDEIDEYTSGKRSSDILSKYKELQGCMEINNVSINTGTFKNNPHYRVKGV